MKQRSKICSNEKKGQNSQKSEENIQFQRQVNIIQTSIKKTNKHVEVVKGERSETKELNIHVKTITSKFLIKCILSNEMNFSDKEVFEEYKAMKANFESTEYLFKNLSREMKGKVLNFYQSSKIAKELLNSDRMFLENKIVMVKFLQKIASSVETPIASWKQIYFKNKKSRQNK